MEFVIFGSAVVTLFGIGFLFSKMDANLSYSDYKKAFKKSDEE